jgi:hypothetical protein
VNPFWGLQVQTISGLQIRKKNALFSLLDHFKKFQNFKSLLVVADDVKTGNLGG